MISYLGSLVQFSPAAGRAGRCRQTVCVCVEHSPCSGQATRSFGGFSPGAACLCPRGERLGQPEVCARSPRAWRSFSLLRECPGRPEAWGPLQECAAPFLSAVSGPGSQRLGAFSPGAVRLFPPRRAAREARGLVPSPLARCAFSLHGEQLRQPDAWRPLPWHGAPFPSAAPARAAGWVSGSL